MKRAAILAVLGCMAILAGCAQEDTVNRDIEIQAEEREAVTYEMTQVTRGTVANPLVIKCLYTQTEEEDLSFALDKEVIEAVYVTEGDTVSRGDLLASVDLESAEEQLRELSHRLEMDQLALRQLEETKAFDLEQADILYYYTYMTQEDQKNLREQKQSIEESYADRLTDMQDTIYFEQKRLEELRAYIRQGALYAPMDGVVSFVRSNLEGSLTEAGSRIMAIYDEASCLFHSENVEAIPYLDPEQQYIVVCGLGSAQREYNVAPAKVDAWGEEIYFRLLDAEYDPNNIIQGNITIYTEEARDVLCVDRKAVHSSGDQNYVYMLDENGIRRMQFVEAGIWGVEQVEIKSGLSEGDYVILK